VDAKKRGDSGKGAKGRHPDSGPWTRESVFGVFKGKDEVQLNGLGPGGEGSRGVRGSDIGWCEPMGRGSKRQGPMDLIWEKKGEFAIMEKDRESG